MNSKVYTPSKGNKKRVASACLAVMMSASAVATNFFGLEASKIVAHAESEEVTLPYSNEYRSSYNGDYEVGKTYYDIGVLYGHAYHDGTSWNDKASDATYQREGWQVYNVKSFLDKDGDGYDSKGKMVNTIPFTTDINLPTANMNERELMCWQVYATPEERRTRYLERTDLPDFGTPTFMGDSTPAYYIAKGTVTRDDKGNVFIDWDVRSWVSDSDTWINGDTFADTNITGLTSAVEKKNGDVDFDSYFGSKSFAEYNDELADMWDAAKFESQLDINEPFTFDANADIDTWWKGVAANIYRTPVTMVGTYKRNTVNQYEIDYEYETSLSADTSVDILGNEYETDLSGKVNASTKWMQIGSEWSSTNMNGTEDVIDRHYTVANTMGSDPVSKFILGTTSDEDLTNASTITANNFNDVLPSAVTMVRTTNPAELELNIYGNMLATVLSDKEDDVKYVGDNTYSIKGSVLREYVDDGYIDYDASGVVDSTYYDVGYEYFKLSPEFDTPEAIENTKNFIINRFAAYANSKKSSAGYDFWPFDDSLEQISKRFKVTGDDAKAVQNSFKDVTVSYDAETGCIKLANLSFADSTAISANHATNFPVIGVLGNLIQMIENKVIYRYNAYFSTGYQRAAGLIRARRVSADNISTLATTNDAGRTNDVKTGIATNEATIIDTVHYEGLTPEVSYTVVGALYDVETGKAIKADGSISTANDVISFEPSADYATAAKTFEPEEADGSVDLTFNYDASKLAGHKIVVCEKIYLTSSKQQVGSHVDKTDANQTVMIEVPSVGTSASANGSRTAKPVKEITITDEIEFSGLIPGKAYTIKTVLYDKTAGKKLADTEMSTPFVPDTSFGVTTVEIKFDSSKFGGKSLVVFEKVYDANSVLVASHEDAEDEKQTVTFEELNPEVKTTATNFEKDGKVIELAPTACIYDKVELIGFAGNTTYKLVPSVYDATAGEWLDITIGEDTTETHPSIDVLMDENGKRTIYLPIISDVSVLCN